MTLPLVVHVTHEAAMKIGGIGAVLEGLLATDAYNRYVDRTILAGPLPVWDADQMARILSPRSRLQVRYASRFNIFGSVDPAVGKRLLQAEKELNVDIFYAETAFGAHRHEILLLDPSRLLPEINSAFATRLQAQFDLNVGRYSYDLEWQLFIDLAFPLIRALEALIGAAEPEAARRCLIAHDWMGLPAAFAARLAGPPGTWSTVFYAHEVAPVRRLIEEHEGHDTRFYNVMRKGQDWSLYLDNLFGDQHDLYKVPLLHRAAQCDAILAVSDLVVDELRFFGAAFHERPIDRVYNGVPAHATSLAEKREARARLQAYGANLLGFTPDYVMSHVTRMVLSKGLWRDGKVLAHLARALRDDRQSAVLFVLSTALAAGRHPDQVREWEQAYGWPVHHRVDNGELTGSEIPFFYDVVEPFNRRHPNVKMVFVNQFGWDRLRCGERMPADMSFADLRVGTDLEFGQSIYEPFGIAQLEPLTQGAVCCTSSVCGCRGFVQRIRDQGIEVPLHIEADYVTLPSMWEDASPFQALDIGHALRNQVEEENSLQTAQRIHALLPRTDRTRAQYLEIGQHASQAMGWEVVARDYFIPALQRLQARLS